MTFSPFHNKPIYRFSQSHFLKVNTH